MDVVRVNPAKYRIAAAIGSSGVSRTGAVSAYREQPLPTAAAVLWTPLAKSAAPDPVYPIFITQRALEAVHAQVAALPEGASSLGFLTGEVCLSPETRLPYVVVESTIHIPWAIAGDHLESALVQGRAIAQPEVARTGDQLLGWYHSLVVGQARLSLSDVEAHSACFDEPWNVALVVARGDGAELTGGMFRIGPDAARSGDHLPFYVLSDRDTPVTPWANYRAHRLALSTDVAPPPAVLDPPPLLFPDEDVEPGTPAPPSRLRAMAKPAARAARIAAVGLVTAGALFGGYRVLVPGTAGGAPDPARPLSAVVTSDRLDGLADTVGFAVAAFDIRARLYESRKMNCTDLARGLIDLEERWIAHNGAQRLAAPTQTSDSARAARDRKLNADVGAVERRFARTGCPRP